MRDDYDCYDCGDKCLSSESNSKIYEDNLTYEYIKEVHSDQTLKTIAVM